MALRRQLQFLLVVSQLQSIPALWETSRCYPAPCFLDAAMQASMPHARAWRLGMAAPGGTAQPESCNCSTSLAPLRRVFQAWRAAERGQRRISDLDIGGAPVPTPSIGRCASTAFSHRDFRWAARERGAWLQMKLVLDRALLKLKGNILPRVLRWTIIGRFDTHKPSM